MRNTGGRCGGGKVQERVVPATPHCKPLRTEIGFAFQNGSNALKTLGFACLQHSVG